MTIVAIDGPGGAGKSTVARALAARLGVSMLDTGAMYRAVALLVLRSGIDPGDAAAVEEVARSIKLEMPDDGRVLVDGEDVSALIRGEDVDAVVSHVAAHPGARRSLVERQRSWARAHGGGVVEGRDITSVVLPEADLKVYLTASHGVRAARRAAQHGHARASEAIRNRDALDSGRADSPLTVATGAIVVDSTGRSPDEVVAELMGHLDRAPGSPSRVQGASPDGEPGASPSRVQGGSPDGEPGASPSRVQGGLPGGSPSRVPGGSPGGELGGSPSRVLGGSPGGEPGTLGAVPGSLAARDLVDVPASARSGLAKVRAGELRFYAACRFVAVGSSLLAFPGPVIGAEHLPRDGAYILAPVHRSYLDWLVVARVTRRRLRYVVKGEVWKVKAVGRLLELLGAFPVRRGAADRESLDTALSVLEGGEPLVVFPEGTRGSGPTIGELRDGAAYLALRAGVPIVPVGIAGTEHAMPKGKRLPRPARVCLVVGPPIQPNGHETAASGVKDREAGRAASRSRRVTRSSTKRLSAVLGSSLQELLDEASRREAARRSR